MSHKAPSKLLMYPLMLDKFRVNYNDYMVGFLCFLYFSSWCRHVQDPFLLPARFTGCFEVETPVSVILVILQVTGVYTHLERILKLMVLLVISR